MMKKKTKTKIKRRRKINTKSKTFSSKIFLLGMIMLAILIFILLIIEYVNFGFVSEIFSQEYKVEVKDECSIIMGNLLHTIRDSTDCNLQCNNRCNIDGNKFVDSEFTLLNNSCNSCNCYCK